MVSDHGSLPKQKHLPEAGPKKPVPLPETFSLYHCLLLVSRVIDHNIVKTRRVWSICS